MAVVPDGCVDLLWIEGRLAVAGPDEAAALTTLAPGMTVLGIHFRPGAAMKWLGLPMCEIVGQQIDLQNIWRGPVQDLADWIGDVEMPAERLHRLEASLVRVAPTVEFPAQDMQLLFDSLTSDETRPSLKAIRDELGVSERSLRRELCGILGDAA